MEQYLYKPNIGKSDYNFVLAYPASEEFALSSLGYMKLFMLSDTDKDINAMRVSTDKPIFPYKNTHAVAFSMSFDFDFNGVFKILEDNKIPFFTSERTEEHPLIFAGGPVITTNPAPYKKIFDFMLIGDGEKSFEQVLNVLKQKRDKYETLKELAKINGVYVPNFDNKVKNLSEPLENVIYTPILSDNSYFKNTFVIEVQRGCMNRCGFCMASYLNLPFRSYIYEDIINAIDLGLEHTNKIALLGAQVSAHPDFSKIIKYITDKIDSGMNIEFGISSLRTDSITPDLVKLLVKGGQKTSTIAIEAASQRLRNFINKNLTDEQILNAVKTCRENGLKGLKIYSMIGIPNETDKDINAFVELAKTIKAQNKGFNIAFSFSSFVPKPQTPFQWEKREDTKSLEKKQKYLQKELSKIGIETKFSSIKWDYWQTVLSRGGEDISDFLVEVYRQGGNLGDYKSALKTVNPDIEKAVNGFDFEDKLPWDMVESNVKKEHLINENKRLYAKLQ